MKTAGIWESPLGAVTARMPLLIAGGASSGPLWSDGSGRRSPACKYHECVI
jgi:hypothetical protein